MALKHFLKIQIRFLMSNLKQAEQALQRFCFMLHVEGCLLGRRGDLHFFFSNFFYLKLLYKFRQPYWFCKLVLDENCLVKLLADSASCLGMCGRIAHQIKLRNQLIYFQRPVKNNSKEYLCVTVSGRASGSLEIGELLQLERIVEGD